MCEFLSSCRINLHENGPCMPSLSDNVMVALHLFTSFKFIKREKIIQIYPL